MAKKSAARKPTAAPARRRRGRRKGVLSAFVGAITAVLTVLFLTIQGTFLLVALIVSVLVSALTLLAEFMPDPNARTGGSDRQRPPTKTAQTPKSGGKRGSAAIIRCTATGKPIDSCSCASKHIRTEDGARRYKSRVGAPLVTAGSKRASSGNVASFSPDRRRNLDLGRHGDRPAG